LFPGGEGGAPLFQGAGEIAHASQVAGKTKAGFSELTLKIGIR
jgi:hypothetical protein